jgi:hypothetical protein
MAGQLSVALVYTVESKKLYIATHQGSSEGVQIKGTLCRNQFLHTAMQNDLFLGANPKT